VTCTRGFFNRNTNTYTAPASVNADTITVTCTATAQDAAGNEGRATLTVTITAPPGEADPTPPVVTVSPSGITIPLSGGSETLQLVVTDNVGVNHARIVVVDMGDDFVFGIDGSTLTNFGDCAASMFTGSGELGYDVDIGSCSTNRRVGRLEGREWRAERPVTFSVSAKPGSSLAGRLTCEIEASDAAGNTGSATFTVSIADSNSAESAASSSSAAPTAPCPDGFTESSNSPLGDMTLCTGPLGNLTAFAGVLTESARIPYVEGVVYELGGRLDVGQAGPATCAGVTPVVLTVEAGVTIAGDSGADFLVVNRCHRIEARGTAKAPIVFTSKNDIAVAGDRASATGEWGGIVVLGSGRINRCNVPGATGGTAGCENAIEGVTSPDAVYGGGNGAADSGTLEYVTVRHAGAGLNAGLTLGGVGRGATVNYIQVHNSSGDGIRVLGGRAGANYVVLTGSADDQLAMDEGYGGTVEYVIGVQRGGDTSDSGIVVDSVAPDAMPQSTPDIYNFTLLAGDDTEGSGLRVSTGANPYFEAGIVVHGNACLDYDGGAGDGVEGFTPGSDPAFLSVLFDCAGGVLTRRGGVTAQEAVDADRNNRIATHTLEGFVNGPAEAAVPAAAGVPPGNTFLEVVDYIGAVRDADNTWWQGWTCGLEESDPC